MPLPSLDTDLSQLESYDVLIVACGITNVNSISTLFQLLDSSNNDSVTIGT